MRKPPRKEEDLLAVDEREVAPRGRFGVVGTRYHLDAVDRSRTMAMRRIPRLFIFCIRAIGVSVNAPADVSASGWSCQAMKRASNTLHPGRGVPARTSC